MKKSKIIYWIITVLFAGFIASTAIPGLTGSAEGSAFITNLGYPGYIVPFLSAAKLAGCIVILIPFFKKLKEWAYAGLFFDLAGATYSIIMKEGFHTGVLIMLLIIAVGAVSYYFNNTINKPALEG
jgi:hypothetical protein